eukprot:TRINITY_DN82270_c0_g1_i1.p1 TRINITY_DN82270_c0_g1~~TRINITY_DN82270_c0_g1_i1.p1  ORF type:complete len:323 (+),score=108.18 TRINITY_DN82270_c0_g1_i1:99-1067(+)
MDAEKKKEEKGKADAVFYVTKEDGVFAVAPPLADEETIEDGEEDRPPATLEHLFAEEVIAKRNRERGFREKLTSSISSAFVADPEIIPENIQEQMTALNASRVNEESPFYFGPRVVVDEVDESEFAGIGGKSTRSDIFVHGEPPVHFREVERIQEMSDRSAELVDVASLSKTVQRHRERGRVDPADYEDLRERLPTKDRSAFVWEEREVVRRDREDIAGPQQRLHHVAQTRRIIQVRLYFELLAPITVEFDGTKTFEDVREEAQKKKGTSGLVLIYNRVHYKPGASKSRMMLQDVIPASAIEPVAIKAFETRDSQGERDFGG